MSDLPTKHADTQKIPLDWRELSTDDNGNLRESSNDPKPLPSIQTPMAVDESAPISRMMGGAPKWRTLK